MVGLGMRGWALIALGLGAIGCQLALDFDYDFAGAAGAGGVPEYSSAAGASSAGASGAGAGGSSGSSVSDGNGGNGSADGADTYAAGSGPIAGGAAGSGSGGAPGTSGAGGGASGTAGGASAGAGGGGDDPAGPPCSGCVELIVPFAGTPEVANFQIEISDPEPALDFTGGTIEWTVQALSLRPELGLKVSAQNGAELGYVGLYTEPAVPLVSPDFGTGVWTTLRLDVAAFSPTGEDSGAGSDNPELFDKTRLRVLGLELGVRSDVEGPLELHLLIDRVGISGVPGAGVFEFSDGLEGFSLELAPEGATLIHHPSDAD